MARLSRITLADLLELSLAQQAGLDGFENLSPNGRSLGAADFIGMVEMKLGRKVCLGKRGRTRTRTPDRWIDTGNSYHVPVIAIAFHSDTATENRERRHVSGDTIAKDVLVN